MTYEEKLDEVLEWQKQQAEKDRRIKELEAQIEKMKCCGNCKYRELIREYGQWKERFNCKGNGCVCHSKWEIKEK